MAQWITILGGAHSGKTRFAHEVCASLEGVVWWGTASELPQDANWQQHLESLRSSRKSSWLTLEGPWSWPTVTPPASLSDSPLHVAHSPELK
jgi:adenosyl cobinamide kinase/adenosyl cobinamide phosphate guanylyltransferase